jgi:hypothetical protein
MRSHSKSKTLECSMRFAHPLALVLNMVVLAGCPIGAEHYREQFQQQQAEAAKSRDVDRKEDRALSRFKDGDRDATTALALIHREASETDPDSLKHAGETVAAAAKATRDLLDVIAREQKSGEWPTGLNYLRDDNTSWEEPRAFALLRDEAARLAQAAVDFHQRFEASLHGLFPHASAAQWAWLVERSKPTRIQGKCWLSSDGQVVTKTCWTRKGAIASNETSPLPRSRSSSSSSDANTSSAGDSTSSSGTTSPSSSSSSASTSCEPNGTEVAADAYCCSGKIHEIFEDPSNPYSGHKAYICCGTKDSATTNECH